MTRPKVDHYRLLPRARADLSDIWIFTAGRWSVGQADTYIAQLTGTFEAIVESPTMGRERTEFVPPVRIRQHEAHLIIYRIEGDHALIIRVLHGHRDWQTIIADA